MGYLYLICSHKHFRRFAYKMAAKKRHCLRMHASGFRYGCRARARAISLAAVNSVGRVGLDQHYVRAAGAARPTLHRSISGRFAANDRGLLVKGG